MYPSLLPYAPERDVYRLLQVDPNADDEQITAACRRLALAFHPDHNRSPRANEEMQVVNAVRNLLTDPRSRAAYDGARRRYLYDSQGRRSWPPRSSWPPQRSAGSQQRTSWPPQRTSWPPQRSAVAARPVAAAPRTVRPAVAVSAATRTAAPPITPRYVQPAAPRPVVPPIAPFEAPRPVIKVLHERARRVGRALIAAVQGALAELGLARCPSCNERPERGDLYCRWCGNWLGRTEKLTGA